jgi:hypothetical protein
LSTRPTHTKLESYKPNPNENDELNIDRLLLPFGIKRPRREMKR